MEAEEGVSARDGDGEWRRWRESGVAGVGEWRIGGGDSGGEDGGGGAVMRVIGGEAGAVEQGSKQSGKQGVQMWNAKGSERNYLGLTSMAAQPIYAYWVNILRAH